MGKGDVTKIGEKCYPMMAEHEVDFIKTFINHYKIESVLEWGSGNSTIWFPNECPGIKRWVSIEHNGHYFSYLKDKVKKGVVELRWFQDSKKRYVNGAYDEKFDLIIVDGEYRKECLAKAFALLNPKGNIFLHDSGRKEYEAWYKKYRHEIIFEGELRLGEGGFAHRGIAKFNKWQSPSSYWRLAD